LFSGFQRLESQVKTPARIDSCPKEKVGANPPDETAVLRASCELYGKENARATRERAAEPVIKRVLACPSYAASNRTMVILPPLVGLFSLVWAGFDLYGPRASHMRDFDPDEVAHLETAMWRSYYAKQQVRLFNQLAELLRKQFNMPLIRSNLVAYHAAK
jgi:hypothetical protein